VFSAIDELLSLNGWVAALCPTLARPFGQSQLAYEDLIDEDHLYYIAIAIHSADHFLVDQLAVIVQMARRLGSSNIFVSMLDYDSTDATETLVDLCEAVLTLLNVSFRIRRVPGMTADPAAAYYPLEEAHMRNLALEPLHELKQRRGITFARVVWLKGFTCPNDILETIKISFANEAAMVCGMDWAESNGYFIFSDRYIYLDRFSFSHIHLFFSDRWRTRDIDGDQFRQSRSSSKGDAVPPRDKQGILRYNQHLPFQVFCCESGTHVVDPAMSYYLGISYRAGNDFQNLSTADNLSIRGEGAPCLDSSQTWFCRDLWVRTAVDAIEADDRASRASARRRSKREEMADRPGLELAQIKHRDEIQVVNVGAGVDLEEVNDGGLADRKQDDPDANAGSDYDAMPLEEGGLDLPPLEDLEITISNSVFRPARILINPRCLTTYAGVAHTQLARDLFEDREGEEVNKTLLAGKYVLDQWEGAPDSFVCQEQK